jgi:hypothetical protein
MVAMAHEHVGKLCHHLGQWWRWSEEPVGHFRWLPVQAPQHMPMPGTGSVDQSVPQSPVAQSVPQSSLGQTIAATGPLPAPTMARVMQDHSTDAVHVFQSCVCASVMLQIMLNSLCMHAC